MANSSSTSDAAMLSNRVGMLAQFLCVNPAPRLEVSLINGGAVVIGEITSLSRNANGPTVTLNDGRNNHEISVREILELRVHSEKAASA